MCVTTDRAMTRLVAILVILFLVIPAKADVTLRPVPGWTVIQVYGLIKPADARTFESYTENVNPNATLVIVQQQGRLPRGWYRHWYAGSPEEANRRSNGHVRVVMCLDMDRWRNRP